MTSDPEVDRLTLRIVVVERDRDPAAVDTGAEVLELDRVLQRRGHRRGRGDRLGRRGACGRRSPDRWRCPSSPAGRSSGGWPGAVRCRHSILHTRPGSPRGRPLQADEHAPGQRTSCRSSLPGIPRHRSPPPASAPWRHRRTSQRRGLAWPHADVSSPHDARRLRRHQGQADRRRHGEACVELRPSVPPHDHRLPARDPGGGIAGAGTGVRDQSDHRQRDPRRRQTPDRHPGVDRRRRRAG